MANSDYELLMLDMGLVLQRLHNASTEQMLRWVNHHLRREYDLRTFEACLATFRTASKTKPDPAKP